MNKEQQDLILAVHAAVNEAFNDYIEDGDGFSPSDTCEIEDTITGKIKTLFNKYADSFYTPEELAALREAQKTWERVQNPPTYHLRVPSGFRWPCHKLQPDPAQANDQR